MKNIFFILFLLTGFWCRGQTPVNANVSIALPSVALIDLLSGSTPDVTLSMTAPIEAGTKIGAGNSNSSYWLIFTSAVVTGASRSIKGDIVGTVPDGVRLRLDTSPYTGGGQGLTGITVTTPAYLTNAVSTVINNIRGAYTGISYGTDGFMLKYSLEIQTYANIRSGNSSLTVRYTMIDN